jgi:hypothetical protein
MTFASQMIAEVITCSTVNGITEGTVDSNDKIMTMEDNK